MSTTFVNGIDGDPLYAKRAEEDQNGVNIDQYYAKKTDIPSVPVQDVEVNGTSVVNSSGVAEVTVPTNTSDLNNDSGYITSSEAPVQDVEVNGSSVVNASGVAEITVPSQVNADWNSSSGVSQILNKPNLSTVATSGSYNDLTDKPTIPAAQVNSDWNANSGVAQILNKPNLATVATSGDYNDLSNKPSIPSVPVQDVEVDGNSVLNAQGVAEIDLTPYAKSADLAAVATSGDYDDLTNKPSIPAAQVNSDWNANSGVAQILNKPNLSTVATSGSYNDLTDKPTIPSVPVQDVEVDGSSVVNGQGVAEIDLTPYAKSADLAAVATSGDYDDLTNKPTIPAAQVNSDWNSSSGVSQILNKPTLAAVATSGDYNDLSNKPSIPAAQVQSNWSESDPNDVSYIQNKPNLATVATSGSYNDLSDKPSIPTVPVQDVEVDGQSVLNNQGVAEIDLTPYAKSADLASVATSGSYNDLSNKPSIPAAQVNSDWNANSGVAQILNKPNLATVATSGSYNDLTDKPSIPAAQVNSDWNASSGVAQILNKPTLSAVATSGDYDDLTNKPSIPAAQVNSDWNSSSGVSEILNKPSLSTVATSGSYNDLTDKPTIPAAQVNSDWNASSGVAEILNKPTIRNVPDVTSSDNGKVLKATYSGGAGSYAWDTVSSGDGVVYYNLTEITNQDIQDITTAWTSGKAIFIKDDTTTDHDVHVGDIYLVEQGYGSSFIAYASLNGGYTVKVLQCASGGSGASPTIFISYSLNPNISYGTLGLPPYYNASGIHGADKNEFYMGGLDAYGRPVTGGYNHQGSIIYRCRIAQSTTITIPPDPTSVYWEQVSLDEYYSRLRKATVSPTSGAVSLLYEYEGKLVTATSDVTSITNNDGVDSVVIQWTVSSSTTLPTVPSTWHAASANPTSLTVGKTYQLSLLNNCYSIVEFG